LIQLGAQCNYRVSLLFLEHPSCTAAKGTDSTAGSVVASAALNQDDQASASGAKPFSALDIATWNAERSVCDSAFVALCEGVSFVECWSVTGVRVAH
jgi:hypothetical protein